MQIVKLLTVLNCSVALMALMACGPQQTAGEVPSGVGQSTDKTTGAGVMGTGSVVEPGVNFTGRVLETMNSAGYTYVLLETQMGELWVAGPNTPLPVGEVITGINSLAMGSYHSKSLDRDFDNLYFVSAFTGPLADSVPSSVTLPADHPKLELPADLNVKGLSTAQPEITISFADAPSEPIAIADLFASRESLSGQLVTVMGEVVKFNESIMGRNWIHLRDGTGDAATGSNDLTITCNEIVKVGDRVKISGIVALDKDFGVGYSYNLLLENARIAKE